MLPIYPSRRPSQEGFSFIELLLAMLIFAIGLLGLAALQNVSLSQGTGGRARGTSAFVAHTVLDRIVAEGQVTASERLMNSTGVPTTNGLSFLGNADGAALNGSLNFDVYGKPIAAGDTTTQAIFTANWLSRDATAAINTGTHTALQEFVVNVTWMESPPSGSSTPVAKALSVSRYVRF